MSFMRRLMTQKVGSSFIPFQEVFYIEGIAATITAPTGCDTANIQMWGSGGRGVPGRWNLGDNTGFNGGDGGAGAYLLKVMSVSGGSSSFTCNVGFGATTTISSTNTTISGAATLTAGKGSNGTFPQPPSAPIDDGLPGDGGVPTGGDAGSLNGDPGVGAGIQGGSSPYGGAGGAGGASGPGPGLAGSAPGGGGGGGSTDTGTEFGGGNGARGEIRIKWYKSVGGTSPVYTIYNIPQTFSATTAPTYPSCAQQQIYSTTTRNVWDTSSAVLRSISFVRSFVAGAGTCDFDSTTSSLSIRIKSNSNSQLPQNFFTSVFTNSGVEFASADAFWSFDTTSPLGNGLYDTIWYWYGVPDSLFTAGTNVNVRFKV